MNLLVLFGRVLYAGMFLVTVPGYFSDNTIRSVAFQGVPMAWFIVPLLGLFALLGGLSILIGYRAKEGAGLLILLLAALIVTIHAFGEVASPAVAALQRSHLMENLGLLGAALLIVYFGSGPWSLENWLKRRYRGRHGTNMIDLTSKRR